VPHLTRRNFLRFGIPAAAAIAIAPQEIWTPERTYFLPPRGGWRKPLWTGTHIFVGPPEVITFPSPSTDWGEIERVWLQGLHDFTERPLPSFEAEYLCNWDSISTPEKGIQHD
jgi:hypothetical protein